MGYERSSEGAPTDQTRLGARGCADRRWWGARRWAIRRSSSGEGWRAGWATTPSVPPTAKGVGVGAGRSRRAVAPQRQGLWPTSEPLRHARSRTIYRHFRRRPRPRTGRGRQGRPAPRWPAAPAVGWSSRCRSIDAVVLWRGRYGRRGVGLPLSRIGQGLVSERSQLQILPPQRVAPDFDPFQGGRSRVPLRGI